MRIGFFGTPTLAAQVLHDLVISDDMDVVFAVTNPDSSYGRHSTLVPSPVKIQAQKYHIPVLQPNTIRDNVEFLDMIASYNCDFFVVVAYGKILPQALLDIPRYMCINVHGSLLPKYRGASPIQSALLNGDIQTGVTIMQMSARMDEWDIITTEVIPIDPDETSASLFDKFADISGNVLIRGLRGLLSGVYKPIPQSHAEATYCTKISKEDGHIDWNEHATTIYRRWQAYTPWPGIFTRYNNKRLLIEKASLSDPDDTIIMATPYGEVVEAMTNAGQVVPMWSGKIGVICGEGILILERVKLEGKKSQNIDEFINGHQAFISSILV